MKSLKPIMLVVLCVLLTLVISCSSSNDETIEASKETERFLELLKKRDYNSVVNFYPAGFFGKISKEDWRSALIKMDSVWQGIESYKLNEVNIENIDGAKYFVLIYNVKYVKTNTRHKFTLEKQNGIYRIIGHDIKQ